MRKGPTKLLITIVKAWGLPHALTIVAGEPRALAELHLQTGIFSFFSLIKDEMLLGVDSEYFVLLPGGKFLDLTLLLLHLTIYSFFIAIILWSKHFGAKHRLICFLTFFILFSIEILLTTLSALMTLPLAQVPLFISVIVLLIGGFLAVIRIASQPPKRITGGT